MSVLVDYSFKYISSGKASFYVPTITVLKTLFMKRYFIVDV